MPEPRLPIIAANWKMHKVHTEAIQFAQKLHYLLEPPDLERVEVVICPPFTDLRTLQTLFDADRMPFGLGAQDVYWETQGAFTGEVSPVMLASLDVTYVIVGHSERRELFGDTDDHVKRKLDAVLAHGMTPIMCCGETEAEHEAGKTIAKISGQLAAALDGLTPAQVGGLVIAYEPIWAIGTGKNATPEIAADVCGTIREIVKGNHGDDAAAGVRIQYGGSVKSGNIELFMKSPDIDGALVGGASLDPEEFARILTVW